MYDLILRLNKCESLEELTLEFSNILKDLKIEKFSICEYNESEFIYKVVYSTEFREDEFLYDIELEEIKIFERLKYQEFYLFLHESVENLKDLNILFPHFVEAYKKVERLINCKNSLIESRAQIEIINEIGDILGNFDIDFVLPKILEEALNVVNGDVGVIMLKEEGKLIEKISWGIPKGVVEKVVNKITSTPLIEEVFETKSSVFIENFSAAEEYDFKLDNRYLIKSIAAIPLFTKNKTLGVLVLLNLSLDEIKKKTLEILSQISAISIENAIFFKDSIEKEKLKNQLKIASELQNSLFPQADIFTDNFYIGGFSIPALNVGGDFYNFYVNDDSSEVIGFVGDVSGKGIPAALLTSMAMILIKTFIRFDSDISTEIFKINNIISRENLSENYFTLGLFKINLKDKKAEILNASHTDIIHISTKDFNIKRYSSNNFPIGMFEDIEYEKIESDISKGDIILCYSDGVIDAVNESGESYELDRLIRLLKSIYQLPPQEIKNKILEDVKEFCGNAQQFDDITLIVFKML